ncbi:hypothetical protein ACIOD2_27350 [Amycolatopsis sp. NPDC088138]|uniref:hypothetical protein n=1 Tax=Amycolatopsis sp. NPDC088138 TaxID=3363938 RepID=UPI00382C7555
MTAREADQPFPDGGDESDLVPLQERADDDLTHSAPSRPKGFRFTIDGAPFRPASEMSAREWEAAARDVAINWPKVNRRYGS